MKSNSYTLLLVLLLLTTSVMGSELWVTPAVDSLDTEVGDWAVTSSGQTHFSFAVPEDFDQFVGVKVVLIGRNDKETTYDLSISISQNALRFDDYTNFIPSTAVTFTRDQLTEIDISPFIDSSLPLYAGEDYVSLYFNTSFARVLGLRFQYENADLHDLEVALQATDADLQSQVSAEVKARVAGDADLESQIDTEEAARIAADGAIQAGLDTETADRISADSELGSSVADETAARIDADADLQSQIDAEAEAREAGDIEEAQARAAAETRVTEAIGEEAEFRLFADMSLQKDLNDGDAVLQAQIDAASCECNCPGPRTFYLSSGEFDGAHVRDGCEPGYHVADMEELARFQQMEYVEGVGEPKGFALAIGSLGWLYSNEDAYSHPSVANCMDFTETDYGCPGGPDYVNCEEGAQLDLANRLEFYGEEYDTMEYMFYTKRVTDCSSSARVWCVSD